MPSVVTVILYVLIVILTFYSSKVLKIALICRDTPLDSLLTLSSRASANVEYQRNLKVCVYVKKTMSALAMAFSSFTRQVRPPTSHNTSMLCDLMSISLDKNHIQLFACTFANPIPWVLINDDFPAELVRRS